MGDGRDESIPVLSRASLALRRLLRNGASRMSPPNQLAYDYRDCRKKQQIEDISVSRDCRPPEGLTQQHIVRDNGRRCRDDRWAHPIGDRDSHDEQHDEVLEDERWPAEPRNRVRDSNGDCKRRCIACHWQATGPSPPNYLHALIVPGVFVLVTRNRELLLTAAVAEIRTSPVRAYTDTRSEDEGCSGIRCRLSDGRAAILGRYVTRGV